MTHRVKATAPVGSQPGTAEATPIFALRSVTKRFGGIVAVEDVDFDLYPGEVHALVGENGAGKSTLMKIVDGLYQPDEGTLEVHGHGASFHSPRDAEAAGIAMIPQELDLFPDLSVAENLFVGRTRPRRPWGGVDRETMQRQARERFASLGVDIEVTAPIRLLSAANRQIVLIARALLGEARAVVMDEPTSSLTDREVERLFAIISDLNDRGVGVVYISHRLGEVFTVASRISVLRDGVLVGSGPAKEFDSGDLVRLMVGRSFTEQFQRNRREPGDVVLELRAASRPGEFEGVDLRVRAGEIVGLAGLIGAGRTELAQAIFGIHPIEQGEVAIGGKRVAITSPQVAMEHGICYVPEERQSQGLILEHPIIENITLTVLDRISRLGFVPRAQERLIGERFAGSLSIKGAPLEAPALRLSGGNQQKVVLAKWLATEPVVLLLDEPTRGIDVGAKREIFRLMDELAQQGKAIVMISSELEEVLSMSDRIVVMRGGRVAAELDAEEATQEKVMAAATGVQVLFGGGLEEAAG
jgi:ABC-type sugar transport system ATPase subunit